ncbi:transposase [Clostridium sp. DJ247]|uniref:IS91 family transposase n=1 Tax=Clostridium sp. DJ247 TaxID=2726188 RepID=UPI00162AD7BC|nr:transposase [Clostridium sp. DJ247]MBC2582812.1 transposase [Clostridium sp. DJ247]
MKKSNGIIKQIFKDYFKEFWQNKNDKFPEQMREHLFKEVLKMINCGEFALGFIAYICMQCLEKINIGFSCKSRFCNRCGKKYISDWVEKQVRRILDVPHRHCIFTIPKEFRKYFYWNRKSLKDLQDMAYQVIEEYINNVNGKNRAAFDKKKRIKKGGAIWQCGMISVVHTFGRSLGFNPHIHALVPELKRKNNRIVDFHYFEYKYIRKTWQYKLTRYMIKKQPEMRSEYGSLFKIYPHGFYVHVKPRMRSARWCARYIGRYLARPAIAEYRIISYAGKMVHFWYIDHETAKRVHEIITAQEFIGKLIMHIPPKRFKMVRRYGVYAGSIQQKMKTYFSLIKYIKSNYKLKQVTLKQCYEIKDKRLTWRDMIIKNFSKDPLRCKNCGRKMELFQIWHPEYGYLLK